MFSQKTCHQRKLRQNKCLLFNFWLIEFAVIPKKAILQLAIWQNCYFGQFYHSQIEKKTLSLSQFSLATGFFERTRENILHILRALGVQRSIKCKDGKCSLISERIFNLFLFSKEIPNHYLSLGHLLNY